jgi:hypothetical protein
MTPREPTRETLSALRAARKAHRVATDVGVSDVQHLSAVRCRGCGQRFSIDPAAARAGASVDRERVLCPGCRDREASQKAARVPSSPLDETFYAKCARCAYLLRGLTRADRCPECGLKIAASLGGGHPSAPRPLAYSTLPNNCYLTNAETYAREGMPDGPLVAALRAAPADPDELVDESPSLFKWILRRVKLWLEDVDDRRRGAGWLK